MAYGPHSFCNHSGLQLFDFVKEAVICSLVAVIATVSIGTLTRSLLGIRSFQDMLPLKCFHGLVFPWDVWHQAAVTLRLTKGLDTGHFDSPNSMPRFTDTTFLSSMLLTGFAPLIGFGYEGSWDFKLTVVWCPDFGLLGET